MENTKICKICGAEFDPEDNSCPRCGFAPDLQSNNDNHKLPNTVNNITPTKKSSTKVISTIIIIIGVILCFVGLFYKIPSNQLTTYSFLNDDHTVIEEYVGGDAYNYIIGASLTGGEIAGATAAKAIYISVGLLIICIGMIIAVVSKPKKE